jgi:glycosyltransferase involved in cell wall biosynthesis
VTSTPGHGDPPLAVSLDVSAVPASPVGAGRYTIELARALAPRADVSLMLWSRRGDGGRWHGIGPAAVRAEAPDSRVARLTWEQVRLAGLLAGSGAVVHHGPHYTMPARAALPVVVTVHDLTFFDHPEWHEKTKVAVFRHAIRRAAARAQALVCVSQRTAERLAAHVTVRGRVFVVPHGVDHDRFRPTAPDPEAERRMMGALGLRAPYVLFLGTLEPRKAVPDLVRAFASVAPRHQELTLVLAGRSGWGADEIRRAVDESGIGHRVVRTGYVPEDAVPTLLRGAAAVAYPAREEGFGLPALEALACGAPLVTTSGTAMAELSGDAALLIPPGRVDALSDALDAALTPGPQVDDRRRRGFEVAAAYSWDRSAAGHLEAYRWAAAGARGRRATGTGR